MKTEIIKNIFDKLNSLSQEEFEKEINSIKLSPFGKVLLTQGKDYLKNICIQQKLNDPNK